MSTYYTIRDRISCELKINRSRFITSIKKVKCIDEAKDFIAEISSLHKMATHNCWAYIIGPQANTEHSSDNGEPSGTAGAPMLNALKKEKLTNVAVVVTRYFGGVKLGVRGLIDAYGSSVEEGIKHGELQPIIPHSSYELTVPYDFFDTLKHRLNEFNPRYDDIAYSTAVSLHLVIESISKESVEHFLKDWQQAGRINFMHLRDTDD